MNQCNYDLDFEPHVAFSSIPYMNLGDVGSCKTICLIWNHLFPSDCISSEVSVDESSTIHIEGLFCHDPDKLLQTLRYYTSCGIQIGLKIKTLTYTNKIYML